MKRLGTLAVACAAAMSISVVQAHAQSAGQGGPPAGAPGSTVPAPVAVPAPDRVDTGKPAVSDSEKFFEKAAIANMTEIKLGQLATQRAESADVKQFAQTLVDDHTKALEQLKEAAQKANVTLPTDIDSKHQKKVDKLTETSGAEFDRKYIDAMVDAHKDVAKMLKDESKKSASGAVGTSGNSTSGTAGTSGTDAKGTAGTSGTVVDAATAPAAEWAAATLPGVEQHLDHAKQLQETLKASGKNSPATTPTATTPTSSTPDKPATPPSPSPHP
jgi:predicted outer membrane protein